MSYSHSFSTLRRFAWLFPIAVAIGAACSDSADPGGGRATGAGTGSPTTSGAATGSGTTGTSGNSVSAGSSGSVTSTGAGGAGTSGSVTSTTSGSVASTTSGSVTSTTGDPAGSGGSASGTTGGAGGTGSGTGGARDAGPIATDGGGATFGDKSCGAGVTPMGIGRCANAPKYIVAKGTALTIANFEDLGPTMNHNTIFFGDGRAGNFIDLRAQTQGAITMVIAQTPSTSGSGMSWALHYSGTYTSGSMPMFAVPVADCYDTRAYKGVSFWIKGNPSAGNDMLKFQVHTPVAQPAPSGGCSAADAAAGKCDDHYAKFVPITNNWTRQVIHWGDLKQNCPSNVAAGYNPAQYNEMFSWAIPKAGAGFDVWFDDFTFYTNDADVPTNSLSDIVTEATFNEMWSLANADGTFMNLRNPFYTYQGMMSAVGGFAGFATTGDSKARRLEAAAFFSNVAHETDQLGIVEESICTGGRVATCGTRYGVAPNGLSYHGRGPIQLTLGVNYASAKAALGLSGAQDIVQNPAVVNMDANIAWRTGFWFWMGGLSGGGTTPHAAINGGQGFGATIRVINGIECDGANAGAVANRIRHFLRFSYLFGLDPGIFANGC